MCRYFVDGGMQNNHKGVGFFSWGNFPFMCRDMRVIICGIELSHVLGFLTISGEFKECTDRLYISLGALYWCASFA